MDYPVSKHKNPRGYRGRKSTNHSAKNLASRWLGQTAAQSEGREIIEAWPEIVGPKFAGMSEAIAFTHGTLRVRVKNSTLYTLFVQYEKERLRMALKARFPAVNDIDFKMG